MSTIELRMSGSLQRNELPEPVERYLERSIRPGDDAPAQVEIHQTGQMFRREGSRAMRFAAAERFATDRVAFVWDARFAAGPVSPLRVTDGYEDEHGTLRVRVFGIPLQKQSGHEVAVGEAYRYLAELPWVPYAIAANPQLKWRMTDERIVEVCTEVQGERAAVALAFDPGGDIVRSSATSRPRTLDGRSIKCAWGGDFRNYRWLGAIRMPTEAEVYWESPEGRFVYWRATINEARRRGERFTLRD